VQSKEQTHRYYLRTKELHPDRLKEYRKNAYQRNKKKINKRNKRWLKDNPEKAREIQRRHRIKHRQDTIEKRQLLKSDVLTHYGNGVLSCIMCGYKNIDALSIDHVDGRGKAHRKEIRRTGTEFYRWLIKNNYPVGFRTLCMNCQWLEKERIRKQSVHQK
jgi:hypothetical protein